MATNAKAAAAKPEDPTVPKGSNKKMLIGGVVALVFIIAAGAAGMMFANKGKDPHAPQVEEVKAAPPKAAIFVMLEPYTVNLKRETSDQYLQMGITLKVFEPAIEVQIKANQPEIRSKILQLLTTKTATELLTAEGKTKLVKEIIMLGNAVIGIAPPPPVVVYAPLPVAASAVADPHAAAPVPAPAYQAPVEPKGIIDVLFTSFIIQ